MAPEPLFEYKGNHYTISPTNINPNTLIDLGKHKVRAGQFIKDSSPANKEALGLIATVLFQQTSKL